MAGHWSGAEDDKAVVGVAVQRLCWHMLRQGSEVKLWETIRGIKEILGHSLDPIHSCYRRSTYVDGRVDVWPVHACLYVLDLYLYNLWFMVLYFICLAGGGCLIEPPNKALFLFSLCSCDPELWGGSF